ncbi:MAG: hypothetical protein RI897_2518 [Verrucomicrobiota bacterium]
MERAFVAAGFGVVPVAVHGASEGGGEAIFDIEITGVEGEEGLSAEFPVFGTHGLIEDGVGDFDFGAVRSLDFPVFQFGIGEQAEDIACGGGCFGGHGEQFLFARGEDMLAGAEEVIEIVLIELEFGLFEPVLELAFGDGEEFRTEPGECFAVLGCEALCALEEGEGFGLAHILVVAESGVGVEFLQLDAEVVPFLQGFEELAGVL